MTNRVRKNVNLSQDTIKKGNDLAKHLKRSFSGMAEVVIDQAWLTELANGKRRIKKAV